MTFLFPGLADTLSLRTWAAWFSARKDWTSEGWDSPEKQWPLLQLKPLRNHMPCELSLLQLHARDKHPYPIIGGDSMLQARNQGSSQQVGSSIPRKSGGFSLSGSVKNIDFKNSLVVQWLSLSIFTTVAWGSIPAQVTKIPQASRNGQGKKKVLLNCLD